MHAIAQANITMSLSETKPKKNAFIHPGSTRLAYLTTLTSWCFLLKQVVGSIMASHPRFSLPSTSSSSKCPPRPRASRDQHPPCPFSSAVRSIILTSGRNNIGQPPPPTSSLFTPSPFYMNMMLRQPANRPQNLFLQKDLGGS